LLATVVADTAPADLRGTAYGFFNLISGVAMLLASVVPVSCEIDQGHQSRSTLGQFFA